MCRLRKVAVSKICFNVGVLFIVVGLLLAWIPTSASASEIQPLQSGSISQNNGLEEVTETGPEVAGHIEGIYFIDTRNDNIMRTLNGKELPSGIGMVGVLVGWFNDSGSSVTGHIKATVTKPDGNTSPLEVIADQDTTLSSGQSVIVNIAMFIDQSGSWVLDAQLTDLSTSLELGTASASFTIAGISSAFEGDPRECHAPCSVTFTNLVTGGALPYGNVSWNFGDGTVVEGAAVHFKETVTHNYTSPGVFHVKLQVWDDENLTASHVEVDYITIHERVEYTRTWSFPQLGFFPKHLPDSFTDEVVLADLVPDLPDQVIGVFFWDDKDLEWKFWAPGVGGVTLQTLGGGHTYDYMVGVNGSCKWVISLS